MKRNLYPDQSPEIMKSELPVQPEANELPQTPQPQSVPEENPVGKTNLPRINFNFVGRIKKLIPLVIIVTVLLIILTVILSVFSRIGNGEPEATPTPTPTATPGQQIFNPSPYVDDEGVAKIEKDIADFENELGEIEFREETLRLPVLDWDINFN